MLLGPAGGSTTVDTAGGDLFLMMFGCGGWTLLPLTPLKPLAGAAGAGRVVARRGGPNLGSA